MYDIFIGTKAFHTLYDKQQQYQSLERFTGKRYDCNMIWFVLEYFFRASYFYRYSIDSPQVNRDEKACLIFHEDDV